MKKAAIIGYGKSGKGAEKILVKQGYNSIDKYDDNKADCYKIADFQDKYDVTVISPGVAFDKLPVVPYSYTSEVELAYKMLPKRSKIIAITGTNGKSTVTFLTAQILNKAGLKAVACGNIGETFADAVLDASMGTIFVVELSSYQIELLNDFKVDAAAIINITPDHLDRYGSMDNYINAKLKLLKFIDSDGVLITASETKIANEGLKAKFSVKYMDETFCAWPIKEDNYIYFGSFCADVLKFKLFGHHNLVNLSFALALAATIAELKGDVSVLVEELEGMPHRTEKVVEHGNITWINDSKATNVASSVVALKGCKYPTVVLLGGRDKSGDFAELAGELNKCASKVCFFGEAAEIIAKQLEGKLTAETLKFDTLKKCVYELAKIVKSGETVILTPGCASFDEFSNFEERGEKFTEYIKDAIKDRC